MNNSILFFFQFWPALRAGSSVSNLLHLSPKALASIMLGVWSRGSLGSFNHDDNNNHHHHHHPPPLSSSCCNGTHLSYLWLAAHSLSRMQAACYRVNRQSAFLFSPLSLSLIPSSCKCNACQKKKVQNLAPRHLFTSSFSAILFGLPVMSYSKLGILFFRYSKSHAHAHTQ